MSRTEDSIVVNDYHETEVNTLYRKVYKESTSEMEKYGKWVEDNGQDPLNRYNFWFKNADIFLGMEKPNPSDKHQISLMAWMMNERIRPDKMEKQELLAKIRERFPEIEI